MFIADVGRLWFRVGSRPIIAAVPRAVLLAVYRSKNSGVVHRLVAEAERHGWSVRLWALDKSDPTLQPFTRGIGPGTKFDLIDRLIADGEIDAGDWVVVADDDVELVRGSLADLVSIADQAHFAFAQPAHLPTSHRSHLVTLERPMSVARLTRFVEIGPLFAVHPDWVSQAFGVGELYGMGWGLDVRWSSLQGARFGVVDLVAMRHLEPAGQSYSTVEERVRSQEQMASKGLDYEALQQTLSVWRPWRRRAPWRTAAPDVDVI